MLFMFLVIFTGGVDFISLIPFKYSSMKNWPLRQCDVFATVGEFFLVYFLLYLFLPGLLYVPFGIIDTHVVGIYIFINHIL